MGEPRVTLDDLGAWLIKGNDGRADLAGRFEREPRVGSWCVQPGYRSRLMRAGQPVVLWASGSRTSGVWGLGVVTGPVEPGEDGGRPQVPLDLTVEPPDRRMPRALLRADPRLAGAEVFRQPQGSNPSFLTRAEFAALREHLGKG